MSWEERMGLEWLMRIVALLFSLADHAERVSTRSYRVRRRVLEVLRRAETAAYRCIAGTATDLGVPVPATAIIAAGEWTGGLDENDTPEDALRMAARFRALAVALAWLVQVAQAHGVSPTRIGRPDRSCAQHQVPRGRSTSSLLTPGLSAAPASIRAPPCCAVS